MSGTKVPESELRSSRFLDVYPWSCPVLDTEDSVHDRALLHGRKITDKDLGSAQCCQGEELNLCGLELLGIWESPTTLVVSAPAPLIPTLTLCCMPLSSVLLVAPM